MDLKDIKELIALMRRNDLSEFEMEREGFRIKLKKGGDQVIAQYPIQYSQPQPSPGGYVAPAAAPVASGGPAPESKPAGREILSPMVGTFYASPSPESAAYVAAGSAVSEDTVVCIIEAMKVMNEIKAEVRGEIAEILVENGKPVQFGQPLFRLK